MVAAVFVALVGLLTGPAASATPLLRVGTAVAPTAVPAGQRVGTHEPIPAGQRRARAPGYDQTTVGSGVAPEVGASAKTLGARPDIDIPVRDDGLVRPGTGGMSVNDSPTAMPEFRRPPSFGGTGKDLNMYCVEACDLGPSLQYSPDPAGGGHGLIEPAWEMPFEKYQGYLGGTQGSWSEVQP